MAKKRKSTPHHGEIVTRSNLPPLIATIEEVIDSHTVRLSRPAARTAINVPNAWVGTDTWQAFHNATTDAFLGGGQVDTSDNSYLVIFKGAPVRGAFYLTLECEKCFTKLPVAIDPSLGTKQMVIGPGRISTPCMTCRDMVRGPVDYLKSVRWK